MRIVKYPTMINNHKCTAIVTLDLCGYEQIQIVTKIYSGKKHFGDHPEFVFRKIVPVDTYINEAISEWELLKNTRRKAGK